MAAAARRSVALLLACPLGLGGCSFFLTRPPPERFVDPARPIAPIASCDSVAPPVADTLLALFLTTVTVHAAVEGKATGGAIIVAGAGVAGLAISALYGFEARRECTQVEVLNAQCMKGDRTACLALNPDFQAGQPAVAPLLCASDAACGPGQRCVGSACVAGPAPPAPGAPAGPPLPPGTSR
jgi:hypothetical protein